MLMFLLIRLIILFSLFSQMTTTMTMMDGVDGLIRDGSRMWDTTDVCLNYFDGTKSGLWADVDAENMEERTY